MILIENMDKDWSYIFNILQIEFEFKLIFCQYYSFI